MNITKKSVISCCAAIGLAAFSILAGAQEHHWNACKDQANKEDCMHAQMQKHMAEHEAKLHDALKLTATQEPAWKTFTDTVHQQIAAMEAEHKAEPSKADIEKLSAPERLENHLNREQKHITAMQTHLAALKTFYAVLTPDQQATFNKELAHFGHHSKGQWHHHGDMPPPTTPTTPAAQH